MADNTALLQQAATSYKSKDLAGAEKTLREILATNPRDAHALHMMGAIGHEVKRYEFAEELVRMAIEIEPNVADFFVTLGMICRDQVKTDEAFVCFQQAINLDSQHVRALFEMGTLSREVGTRTRNKNLLEGAMSFYTRALAIRADEETYINIAYLHHLHDRFADAIATGEACLKRYPNSYKALVGMASSHDFIQQYEESLQYCKRALIVEPDRYEIYANMATTLKNLGRLDEAIATQKKVIEFVPEKAWIYSNMLLTMVYASSVSPEELAEASRQFGERIADPLIRKRPFQNNRNPNRKLRIGYVSPDFRGHAVTFFLAPVYNCDKENFEIYAYSRTEKEDHMTEHVKQFFDHWRDIKYLSDEKTADLIEKDKIDILVDLAGHTGNNNLLMFARKPAPIQVSWLGYPATTGMKSIDYRITDPYAEPPGMTEHLNVEELWRLPDIFCAYRAHPNSPAVIDHPPFEDNGYITFGCFNNFTKVTDPVLQTWARILEHVPNSRLLLEISGIGNEKTKSETIARLVKQGLPLERLILEQRSTLNQYVLYNKIDIALDPFPCNGGTTSMDTLWMGVPLVTLAGRHFVSRMGVTIMTNAGLPELIAQNIDDYIKIAADLANDRDKLKKLRDGLRDKVAASPVMDQKRFARNMETAYREMWKKWVSR